jgi:hypothetical protein
MTTTESSLKRLHTRVVPGAPVTARDLANLGISADLAGYYVRAGWLLRLGRGVYAHPATQLDLHASLSLLERQFPGLHVGGKTALDWQGVRQYVMQGSALQLYGWTAGRLPGWFAARFQSEYHRKRLFQEEPAALLHVGPLNRRSGAPSVSAPERAMLEMLSEVGVRQALQEARELVESSYALRSEVLGELLLRCTSVKTVRLCLQLGRAVAAPWVSKLEGLALPTGSARPWVSRSDEGLLVLKA